jgi:hypothetical protein
MTNKQLTGNQEDIRLNTAESVPKGIKQWAPVVVIIVRVGMGKRHGFTRNRENGR